MIRELKIHTNDIYQQLRRRQRPWLLTPTEN